MALADMAKKSAAPPEGDAEAAGTFEKKDISSVIPEAMRDVVQRIVAAGMKLMFDPATRKHLLQGIAEQKPVPVKIAENVTGLMLMLDQKAQQSGQQGGLPPDAIFPAGYELAAEAGDILVKAGQPVSQDDFNAAIQTLYVMLSKKMGASDDQIMGEAAKHVQGGDDEGAETAPDAEAPEGEAPTGGVPADPAAAPPITPAPNAAPPGDVPPPVGDEEEEPV